jgi:hypothetical protein
MFSAVTGGDWEPPPKTSADSSELDPQAAKIIAAAASVKIFKRISCPLPSIQAMSR